MPSATLTRVAGVGADPSFTNLLANAKRTDLSPKLGTELANIQLAQLTDDQVEELALFISQRGCVFFRDQELSEDKQVELGKRFGGVADHVHATGTHPSLIKLYADEHSKTVSGEAWHSDMCEETIPPAFSILLIEKTPPSGGDTMFANMYAAYDKLSPHMKKSLSGLTAQNRRPTSSLRPEKIDRSQINTHPLIRTHPVTGWQMLFANPAFTTYIPGMTVPESQAILNFLEAHVDKGSEFQIRFHWRPNSVAIWDNRAVQHQAVWDYWPHVRQGRRVAVQGDKPFYDEKGVSQTEALFGEKMQPSWKRLQDYRNS